MVRLAFITEGESEKIVIDSKPFKDWCRASGIEVCDPVIDAGGGGNLLPRNISVFVARVKKSNPDYIIILTDLEADVSVAAVRQRIDKPSEVFHVSVAVKALEAWFLADADATTRWLKSDSWEIYPEKTTTMPWDRLKELAKQHRARGPGNSKPIFAKHFIEKYGFSVERAANHPNCPSVSEFITLLIALSKLG